jgi:ABC-type transport system involved in cytochrome c biogenesis permease subunit
MIAALHAAALLCYAAGALVLGAAFAGKTPDARVGTVLATAGVLLHALGLLAYQRAFDQLPLTGLAPSLSALALVIAVFLLLLELLGDLRSIALLVLPIVIALLLGALLSGLTPTGTPLAFRGAWFAVHVVFAFIAYAGLTLSFAAGVLYLLQFRELKDKRLGRVFRFFPPLPTLDRAGRAGVVVGFPALTVALIVGWSWTLQFRSAMTTEQAQIIWGMFTWLVFAALASLRISRAAGRERRSALASVIGFVVVVIAYLVLRASPAAHGGFL